jgi:hypothetical protein
LKYFIFVFKSERFLLIFCHRFHRKHREHREFNNIRELGILVKKWVFWVVFGLFLQKRGGFECFC